MVSTLTSASAIHRTVLANGIVVLAKENPAADIIAARLFLRAGSRWETDRTAGLSHLMSALLTKGTTRLSSMEIAEQVESIGASLGTDSSTDYFLLSVKTVATDFPAMLQLAAELLRSPSFPEHELELERRLALQTIRSQQEQPFTLGFDQLRQIMYGEHPYARSGLGTEATVAQLTRTDLQQFHSTHFRPDNLVISLSGRIDPEVATALVEQMFGDWASPPILLPVLDPVPVESQPTQAAIAQDTQQSIVMLGYLAPAVSLDATTSQPTSDYVALKLLNSYLGNGLSSRLFVELREKRGLAYEVSAFYPTRLDRAQFVVYMGTAPENTATAIAGLQTEVERLCQIPLDPDTLQAAKNKILGQYALGKQTNAQIAQTFGWYETLNLSVDFDIEFQAAIAALTAPTIQQVAQQYFTQPYISLVGPASAVTQV